MVENPEKDNLEVYDQVYSRNPLPYGAVDRIVLWALQGKVEAIAENSNIKQYFQKLIENLGLDLDIHSILRTMLVFGDAYARLVRDKDDIVRLHHLDPKNVEIKCDKDGNVTEFDAKFGEEVIPYSPENVLHFRWNPQQSTPYGTSLMKGLEPLVEREHQIMSDFLVAFNASISGQPTSFDSERNLSELKTIPYIVAELTQVPVGLLTMKVENEVEYELQMRDFEKLCQSIRDLIRNEIIEKIIKPETIRKIFQETASIGWKRKEKPSLEETKRVLEKIKWGIISPEEAKKQLGLTEYYV